MSNDVKAAAERLREMQGARVDCENASVACVEDMWRLANAYLAEHPADEDEPVTEEWVSLVGLMDVDFVEVLEARMSEGSESAEVGEPRTPFDSRGKVRLLCRALGITLKESP